MMKPIGSAAQFGRWWLGLILALPLFVVHLKTLHMERYYVFKEESTHQLHLPLGISANMIELDYKTMDNTNMSPVINTNALRP